jgi:CxxC-x17-CxxC domain-containing protein
MGNFNRGGGRSGGFNRGGFGGGGRRFGGDRDGARPEMHSAVCAECGDDCQVPFRPSGERPVLCSVCFGKTKGDEGGRPNRYEDRRERPRFEEKRPFHAPQAAGCDNKEVLEQIRKLNHKMDTLIGLLTTEAEQDELAEPVAEEIFVPVAVEESVVAEEPVKEKTAKKEAKKKK